MTMPGDTPSLRPMCGFVAGMVLWILLWVAIGYTVLTLCGCASGRQFTRMQYEHYGSTRETDYSAVVVSVGRYFTLVPDLIEAELSTGTWYGVYEDRTYVLAGAGLSIDLGKARLWVSGKTYTPEDGGDVELLGSTGLEVRWP